MRRRQRKSDCPVHFALEVFGDPWTLLIIRDLMFKDRRTSTEFLRAEEGMWLFSAPPRDAIRARYDFDLTDTWLDHLMQSSVRFSSGGSGSFVSGDGLVITNHHVGADALQKMGGAEFGQLLGGVPGLSDLMQKAPASGGGGLGGMLGGLAGVMGGNAALIATVVGGFSKLGLAADDAKKFVPVILEFLRSKVGPDVVSKLEKTLRA